MPCWIPAGPDIKDLPISTMEQPAGVISKPHPSAPFALLWVFFFLLATQVPGALVVFCLLLWNAWGSADFSAYLSHVQDNDFQQSAQYAAILAPGLAVSQVLTILAGVTVLRVVAGKDWPRRVALRLPAWPQLVMAMGLFPCLVFLGEGIDRLVRPYLPQVIPMENAISSFSHWPWWLGVMIIGFGPGIGEELWCRGFLGRGLIANHGTVGGVLITSFLFGLMHIEPRQVAYATVLGVILHSSYLWTRSLLTPMILHLMNNSLSMLQVSQGGPDLSFLQDLEKATMAQPFWFYGGLLGLLLLCALALWRSQPVIVSLDPSKHNAWTPPFPSMALPPEGSNSMLEYRFPDLISWSCFAGGLILFAGCLWKTMVG